MREIFRIDPNAPKPDPGRVFYTITDKDVGVRFIKTTIGIITLGDVIGYVLPGDVGKRLYRVPNDARDSWLWQCENDTQRDRRLARA